MNAKQLLLTSALVFAGVASAQTVPQEAWVGPPIATTGGAASRGEVAADLARAMGQPQAPQEVWVGAASATSVEVDQLSRAEVMADYNIWTRAGLNGFPPTVYYNPASEEFKARRAEYVRMRFGPEYPVEVARLQQQYEGKTRLVGAPADALPR